MKLIKFGLAIAAAFVAFAATAQQPATKPPAEPPTGKIGYVNSERVMNEAKKTRKAKQELDDKYQKALKDIEAGPQDQVERRMRALEEDVSVEREDALRQYVDRANRIIRRIAMAEDLDVVFLEAAYFAKHIDLTDRVIRELDAEP